MFCEKCGKELNCDEKICSGCGNIMDAPENAPQQTNHSYAPPLQTNPPYAAQPQYQNPSPVIKKAINNKFIELILNAVGSFSGFLSLIYGFILKGKTYPIQYTSRGAYGGDAYTGIQNAAADTSSNLIVIVAILRDALSMLFITIGLAILCYFVCRLFKAIKANKKSIK